MARWMALVLVALLSLGQFALAAEPMPGNRDWRARIGQLAPAAGDDVILTAAGDAIWLERFSTSKDPALHALFAVMRAADISYLNFEMVTADEGYPMPKAVARAETSIISEFVWAGTDLVSTANNHMMDFGPDGLDTTRRVLDDAGIKHSGAGRTMAEALRHTVVERKGLKMALVSVMVSPTPDLGTRATDTSHGVAWIRGETIREPSGKAVIAPRESDLKEMEAAIRAARKDAALVAVSMHIHWGGLEEIDPAGKQLIARAAIDAGADIILGHGPHVVNGIEFYKSKPIFYSIGNFAFQFNRPAYTFFPDVMKTVDRLTADPALYESMIARLVVSPRGEFRRIELLPIELTPAGIPRFAAGGKADAVLEKARRLAAPLGTKVAREGWYAVVELPK